MAKIPGLDRKRQGLFSRIVGINHEFNDDVGIMLSGDLSGIRCHQSCYQVYGRLEWMKDRSV